MKNREINHMYEKYSKFRGVLKEKRDFSDTPYDLEKIMRDRLPRWITEVGKDSRIVDAGCAEGHLLHYLHKAGYKNLTGIDISEDMISRTKERLPQNVNLICNDILSWGKETPSESFDVIFMNQVLEHIPREHTVEVLKELHRILPPGGRLSISVPNMASLIGGFTMAIDFTHVTHFTECSIIQVLELSGFEKNNIVFTSQAPRLFWSTRHPLQVTRRILNRARWHINNGIHKVLYHVLADFPYATVFDPSLSVLAIKR